MSVYSNRLSRISKKRRNPNKAQGNGLSDDSTDFYNNSNENTGLFHLGYLIQNQQTHPFSLTLQDLTNLYVVGPRAQDIYFNLLIQLCDDHRIPVLVVKGYPSEALEEQVCECPLWHLNLETDRITFNALKLSNGQHPSQQISILINLFETFAPLTSTARNLLHVIIWRTIISANKPTIQYLLNTLPFYQHHATAYQEIRRLFSALPHELLAANYDNITLSRISHLPTIISTNDSPTPTFALNLLLLKLLAQENSSLPPLFLFDPPPICSQLFHWLCTRYAKAKAPLVVYQTQENGLAKHISSSGNFILTANPEESPSLLFRHLTESEQHFLKLNDDQVAVRLRSEPITRFITIF